MTGVVTDVTDFASVERAARRGARRVRRGPRAVQQRRRRRRRRGPDVGPHAQRLALGPRRERVGRHPRHQGVRARRCSRRRRGPRRQHVVGQRRHRPAAGHADLRDARRPRSSTITECLYAQLQRGRRAASAPRCCSRARTCCAPGCSSRGATGPTSTPTRRPRQTPPTTIESFEKRMADRRRRAVDYTPVEEVADRVVDAHPRPTGSGSCPPSERTDEQITRPGRSRCSTASNPTTSATSQADRGTDAMSRYLVISADCHAGLPERGVPRVARPGVPRARSTRSSPTAPGMPSSRSAASSTRSSPRSGSEENEEGLRGGWDAARRDKELDADGVAGEVIFPDADAVTGGASAPFGAGLGVERRHDPATCSWPAPAPTTAGWPSCAQDSPERRAGVAHRADHHDVDAAVAEIRRAHESGLRGGILIPSMWAAARAVPRRPLRPGVGGVRGAARCRCTCTPASADKAAYGAARRHLHHRGALVVGAAAAGSCSGRACSSASPACGSASPSAARSGWPTCCGRWTSSTTASTAHEARRSSSPSSMSHAPERVLRPQLLHRRVEHRAGASWPAATRSASATSCGATTSRTPRARGRTPREFLRDAFCDIPVDETAAMLGGNAAEVYGFDVDALRPLADRIGPTPEELGQDGVDLDEVGRRCGPPAARGCTGVEALPRGHRSATAARSPFDPFDPASSRRPTSSTAGCATRAGALVRAAVGLGADPLRRRAARPARPLGQSDIDKAKPSPIVDCCGPRAGRNTASATQTLVQLDDPDHARVRKLMSRRSRARAIERARVTRCRSGSTTRARPAGAERGEAELDRATSRTRCRSRCSARCSASPRRHPQFRVWTAAVARSRDPSSARRSTTSARRCSSEM